MAHIQQVIEKALEHKLSNVVIEAPDWITAVPNGGVAAAERTPKVAASAATAVPSTVTVMPSASSGTWAPSLVDLIDKCKGWNPEAQAATARLKGVVGWFFEEETRFLYAMGRMCTGPLLEQGPYAGKSTSAWTSGLRDGEEKDGRQRQMFLTTDIFPVHPSVGPGTAGDTGYPYYWKREGSLVNLYVNAQIVGSTNEWDSGGRDALLKRGLHDTLVGQLARNGLNSYVYVVTSHTYPQLPYRCAFFDTAHQYAEIVDRFPTWIETVKLAGGNRQLLSFHDVFGGFGEHGDCKSIADNIFNITSEAQFDSTWAAEVHGLHPNWEETLKVIPSAKEFYSSPKSREEELEACTTYCRKIYAELKNPNNRYPCKRGESRDRKSVV